MSHANLSGHICKQTPQPIISQTNSSCLVSQVVMDGMPASLPADAADAAATLAASAPVGLCRLPHSLLMPCRASPRCGGHEVPVPMSVSAIVHVAKRLNVHQLSLSQSHFATIICL